VFFLGAGVMSKKVPGTLGAGGAVRDVELWQKRNRRY